MFKTKTMTNKCQVLTESYCQTYKRWHGIYQRGCSDPLWEDGHNLNLLRDKMEGYVKRGVTPPYNMPLPPEIDPKYMAKRDEIRHNAERALIELSRFKSQSSASLTQNVYALETAIKSNDPLRMRQCQLLMRSFKEYRAIMQEA